MKDPINRHRAKRARGLLTPTPLVDGRALSDRHGALSHVLRLTRRGNYAAALKAQAFRSLESEVKCISKIGSESMLYDWYSLTACSLVAEVYDQSGKYGQPAEVLGRHGEAVAESLQNGALRECGLELDRDHRIRRLIRARVFFTIQYAISRYRRDQYGQARFLLERCARLIEDGDQLLATEDFPWHGTSAALYYWLGHVHRQAQDYHEAQRFFHQAMDRFQLSVDHHWKRHSQTGCGNNRCEGCRERADFASYNVASCMAFGLAWVWCRLGDLEQARTLLAGARTFLRGSAEDTVRFGYANLMLGAVERALVGPQADGELRCHAAIRTLSEALNRFEECEHELYTGRACYELSLAHANLSRIAAQPAGWHQAQAFNERALEIARKHKDSEYWCLALIASSRIACAKQDYRRALSDATLAYDKARETGQNHARVEAMIARGAAYLDYAQACRTRAEEVRELNNAQRDLLEALKQGEQNPRIVAVCSLQLARIEVKRGDLVKADAYFHRWLVVQGEVQNGWIRQLAQLVKREVYPSQALVLNMLDFGETGVYNKMETRLRRFLLERVRHKSPASDAAEFLGVSRQTLFNWRRLQRQK